MVEPIDPPEVTMGELDLEAELIEMMAGQVGTSVVSTVLSMSSDLTLGDLKELAMKEPRAAEVTLLDVFEQYAKDRKLVQV